MGVTPVPVGSSTAMKPVYARFGIAAYWIVNVEGRVVEVFSDPYAGSGVYRRTRTLTPSETLASGTLPELSFPVAELSGQL